MRATRFKCRHCRRMHTTKRPGQRYCGASACQSARKQRWSREKYQNDPDYRLNQKESTEAWLESRGGAARYYRDYRRRKRRCQLSAQTVSSQMSLKQADGVSAQSAGGKGAVPNRGYGSLFAREESVCDTSANRDAEIRNNRIKPGRYKILPAGANKDAEWVEIFMISGS